MAVVPPAPLAFFFDFDLFGVIFATECESTGSTFIRLLVTDVVIATECESTGSTFICLLVTDVVMELLLLTGRSGTIIVIIAVESALLSLEDRTGSGSQFTAPSAAASRFVGAEDAVRVDRLKPGFVIVLTSEVESRLFHQVSCL